MIVKIICDNGNIEYYESDSVVYKKEEGVLSINNGHKIFLNHDSIKSVFVNDERIYTSKRILEKIKNHFSTLTTQGRE